MSADYSRANLAMLACVDPWALEKQVASADPDAVRGWGLRFRQAAASADEAVTLGQRADRTVAGAYRNDGQAVFDKNASTAQTRVKLSGGGEMMEEVARVLIDVGATLEEAKILAAARVVDADADIAETIRRREGYLLDHAQALLGTPGAVDEVERRFLQQAVDLVGMRGREIKRAVDGYDDLLANRIGWLREWGYEARSPQREKVWTENVADFVGDAKDGAVGAVASSAEMVDDLLIHPSGENWARYAGGVGALATGAVGDPLGTLDQVVTGGNIGKGQYGTAAGEVLGGVVFGKFVNKAGELGRLGRAAEDALPRVPGVVDPARHPADPGDPFPELTVAEKGALDQRLADLEAQHPKDFGRLSRDPDKNDGINPGSQDEAKIALDMRDQGTLPPDIGRPPGSGMGDFYSPGQNRYYDVKGIHSDWPPLSTQRDKSLPYRDGYDVADNTDSDLRKSA